MKILIITSASFEDNYGGGQVYVKNIVDELIHQGHHIIIASPGKKTGKLTSYKGADIFTFKIDQFQKNYFLLENFISDINPEVVHVHGFKALFSKACKKMEIPVVTTAHHGGILCPVGTLLNHKDEICKLKASPKNCLTCVLHNIRGGKYSIPIMKTIGPSLGKKLGRTVAKSPKVLYASPVVQAYYSIDKKIKEWKTIHESSDLLIAPSHAIAESMILNGCEKEKIEIVPHGIPLPDEQLINKNHPKNKDAVTKFFFLGRINYIKGLHILCKAFDGINSNAELHIIGGTGNKQEEKYLDSLKKRFKNNNRIFWQGKIPSETVTETIKEFDVMVHPTICLEIYGLNIAEALSMGKPVIATRCGGAEMQIENNVNGILVKPNNVSELKIAMKNHLNNPIDISVNPVPIISIAKHGQKLISTYKAILNNSVAKSRI
ncbi:MAG: glycosyltransferase [Bacteroidota bacterium]